MGFPLFDKLFGNLTKPGLVNPQTGEETYYNSPAARDVAFAQPGMRPEVQTEAPDGVAARVPYQTVDGNVLLPEGSRPAATVNDLPNSYEAVPEVVDTTTQTPKAPDPKFIKPTAREAMYDSAGNVNPNRKALTKAGALVSILMGGLQGAADAAAGGALDAVPGRSSFGAGLAAAQQMPIYRQQQQAKLAMLPWQIRNQRLEAEKTQSEIEKNNATAAKAGYIPIQGVGMGHIDDNGHVSISVPKPNATGVDKQIDAYVNAQGKRVLVMQKPTGETYESVFGDVNQKDAAQGRDDRWIGIRQAEIKAANPKLTDDQAYKMAYDQWVKETKVQPAATRAEIFVNGRAVPMEDPETGAVYYTSAGEAKAAGKNAYAKGTGFQKNAFTPKARFDDIARATLAVNNSLPALDQGNAQRALIYQALSEPELKNVGAVRAFTNSKLFSQMNPQSRNYVVGVLSMREQIMGANQMLTGSAGTSDSRINAIWNVLPNGTEPDSDMARRKMEQVQGMIENLKEAFPLVNVVNKNSGRGQGGGGKRKPLSSYER